MTAVLPDGLWGPEEAEWDKLTEQGPPDTPPARPPIPANLPAEFWDARPVLAQIRQAAHSRGRSADAVFGCALTRISAMASHELRFDFGLGPASLNLFAAIVGPSGVGKSGAQATAEWLVEAPPYLAEPGAFSDGLSLGSGEGIAEAYMGMVERETGEIHRSGPNKGDPKTEKVRAQIRHNVFFYVDEGEALTKTLERSGVTIGPAIRTAWIGATIGQANARMETTRVIQAGSYSLGMAIGYQPRTAQALLADVGPGTPQRFLWLSAIDRTVPAVPADPPPKLRPLLADHAGRPVTGTITCAEPIRVELWQRNLARVWGDTCDDEMDSHVPLMRGKLASLLAVLDGRLRVTLDDWELAGMVWATSCAVRDGLVEWGRRQGDEERERRISDHVLQEERAHVARNAADAKVDRIARLVARHVHDGEGCTRGSVRKTLAGRDKPLFDAALARALESGWVFADGDRVLIPGDVRPA